MFLLSQAALPAKNSSHVVVDWDSSTNRCVVDDDIDAVDILAPSGKVDALLDYEEDIIQHVGGERVLFHAVQGQGQLHILCHEIQSFLEKNSHYVVTFSDILASFLWTIFRKLQVYNSVCLSVSNELQQQFKYTKLGYPERCHNNCFDFKCFRLHCCCFYIVLWLFQWRNKLRSSSI